MFCSAVKNNGEPCTQGISTGKTFMLDDFVYRVCANHFNTINNRIEKGSVLNHGMFTPARRTDFGTKVAEIMDPESTTHIGLQDKVETTQEQLPLTNDAIIPNGVQCRIYLHAVKSSGYQLSTEGVKRFFYIKKVQRNVSSQDKLDNLIAVHFDNNAKTKYVLVIVLGKVFCYKRDMSFAEMDNCVIRRSRFA